MNDEERNIDWALNEIVAAGLGEWKEHFEELPTHRLRVHFALSQFACDFLSLEEYFCIRDRLEAKLTEEEWLYLIRHAGIVQGKIEYDRRMRIYFPHLTSEDIKRKLGYKV